MSTYNHTAVNRQGQSVAPASVTGPLAKGATGNVANLTMTALPDIEDTVQVWDGPLCIAAVTFRRGRDNGKLNVAQTIAKDTSETTRGLQLRVISDGGLTGAYALSYT